MLIFRPPIIAKLSQICGFLPQTNFSQVTLRFSVWETNCMHLYAITKVCFVFQICSKFQSEARECLDPSMDDVFEDLCLQNTYDVAELVKCSFYEEFIHQCNDDLPPSRSDLRKLISCSKCSTSYGWPHFSQIVLQMINVKFSAEEPQCPGDLRFQDQDAPFPPTCSHPELQTKFNVSTCLPPNGVYL